MSTFAIFFIGVYTTAMMAIFIYVTIREMRRAASRMSEGTVPPLVASSAAPMKVLLATDGSPCSDRVVQNVAGRPWPSNSEVEVVTVVHTRVPLLPDPAFTFAAERLEDFEKGRAQAPERVHRAEQCLVANPNLRVTGKVLEGDPEKQILEEARQWAADLVVIGSHGYGPVKRHLLGSVSQAVALHALCSVEIVRCPHANG
jgi:nucleotide-binding universal stress UspA family protein